MFMMLWYIQYIWEMRVFYKLEELLESPMFSLHIWKHKWGYVGREYMP